MTWTKVPAPPTTTVDQIVSSDDPRVLIIGERLWISSAGADWEQGSRITGFRIMRGPNGFQLWGDGGSGPSFFMQHGDTDLTDIVEVGAPGRLGDPSNVTVGVVGDRWVLVPSAARYPDTIVAPGRPAR